MGQDAYLYVYGHPIWVYAYGTSHTRMGLYTHMGENNNKTMWVCFVVISSNNLVAKVMGIILLVLYGLRGRDP